MKYDFDRIIDRRGTNSLKWDVSEDVLPMWVADMDFEVCPAVQKAVQDRAAHGIYGYSVDPSGWAESYVNWWGTRHGWKFRKDAVIFCTGVIPAIASVVRHMTAPGEGVIVLTPVYNVFFNCVGNNGRTVVESELIYHREDMSYDIDWEDLEAKAKREDTKLLLLCNPHNPVGRIWTSEELGRIGEICQANGVMVLSDEIHCDLTLPGKEYVPFASVNDVNRDISITCVAPSKTFNIAGLQSSAVIVPNRRLCRTIWNAINNDEIGEGNCFSQIAAMAAFNEGGEWLDQLREYVAENKRIAAEYINEKVPGLSATVTDATYLLWIDCSELSPDSNKLALHLKNDGRLFITRGSTYGGNGEGFLRMNLALPRSVLMDGLGRLERSARSFAE